MVFCFPVRTAHVLINVCVFTLHANFSKLSFFKRFHFWRSFAKLSGFKRFHCRDRFWKKLSGFNFDYIYASHSTGRLHKVKITVLALSMSTFFALRAIVGIKYYLNNNKQRLRTMALSNDTKIRDPIKIWACAQPGATNMTEYYSYAGERTRRRFLFIVRRPACWRRVWRKTRHTLTLFCSLYFF